MVPCRVTGRCGSLLVHLIPAPRGTGTVSAPVPKLLMMAGIDDSSSASGCTATLGNFTKAIFDTISKQLEGRVSNIRSGKEGMELGCL